jgi:hypothetical protein
MWNRNCPTYFENNNKTRRLTDHSPFTQAISSRSFKLTPPTTRQYFLNGYAILQGKIVERTRVCTTHYKRKPYAGVSYGIEGEPKYCTSADRGRGRCWDPGTLICDLASEQIGKNTDMLKAIRRFRNRLLPAEKRRGTK